MQTSAVSVGPNSRMERYELSATTVLRRIVAEGKETTIELPINPESILSDDAHSIYDYTYLRLKSRPQQNINASSPIFAVDLFCGCGCLTLGALEASQAVGRCFVPLLAADKDRDAIEVYKDNFSPLKTFEGDIKDLIDGTVGSDPTCSERRLIEDYLSSIRPSLLLAGPPCQGYSSLNNYHRQNDDRNILYERVARFIELTLPDNILIENVPTVVRSKDKVVQKTIQLLAEKKYFVDSCVINLAEIGVPQERKRHVVLASKTKKISIQKIVDSKRAATKRSFAWAAGDLEDESPTNQLSIPTKHSQENIKRMAYLHENDAYFLPNSLRPKCHHKPHGYKSMYGRIKMDEPTQTITSGFTSPGQGRFTHPSRIRTITPHEAARLQLIPDFFKFGKATTRRSLSLMIGNAAPMKLSYILGLESLI